jgi:replicative DNA helicase
MAEPARSHLKLVQGSALQWIPDQASMPFDEDCEKAVLGALLLSSDLGYDEEADNTLSFLLPDHFYLEKHQKIYSGMLRLRGQGKKIDPILLIDQFRRDGQYDDVGGHAYMSCLDLGIAPQSMGEYAARIIDRHARRKVISSCNETIREALDGSPHGGAADVIAERLQERARSVTDGLSCLRPDDAFVPAGRGLQALRLPKSRDGFSTGIPRLDHMILKMKPGKLYVISGRPGWGKTSLALQVVSSLAVHGAHPAGLVSLEMTLEDIQERLISQYGSIDYRQVQERHIPNNMQERWDEAERLITDAPFYIDDKGGQSAREICARVRRLRNTRGCDIVAIDYLGIIDLPGRPGQNAIEVGNAVIALNLLAKELGIVVVLLVQMSRDVERLNRKPMMVDLPASSQIEACAQAVMMLYRVKEEGDGKDESRWADDGWIIVPKVKNGITGEVPVKFFGKFQTFREITER